MTPRDPRPPGASAAERRALLGRDDLGTCRLLARLYDAAADDLMAGQPDSAHERVVSAASIRRAARLP